VRRRTNGRDARRGLRSAALHIGPATYAALCLLAIGCAGEGGAPPSPLAREGIGNFAEKLRGEDRVRVAYLGGSITEVDGWRALTTEWLREQGDAAIDEINAALGGTGSYLGLFRLERDVLRHRPDLVFVEFAVNDLKAPPRMIEAALGGIVRQIWRANRRADIVFVYTYARELGPDLRAGRDPPSIAAAEAIAARYGIPSIHVASAVQARLRDGSAVLQAYVKDPAADAGDEAVVLTSDGTHPTAAGHRFYADVVAQVLPELLAAAPVDHGTRLGGRGRADDFDRTRWIPVDDVTRVGAWRTVPRDRRKFGQVWEATAPGSSLEVRTRGRSVELLMLLERGQGGVVEVDVDGTKELRALRSAPVAFRSPGPHIKVLRLAAGLDPAVEHRVRVSLVSPEKHPRALRVLRAAAFLVVDGDATGSAPSSTRREPP
jgi:lysophospholipase L1-like esterase